MSEINLRKLCWLQESIPIIIGLVAWVNKVWLNICMSCFAATNSPSKYCFSHCNEYVCSWWTISCWSLFYN